MLYYVTNSDTGDYIEDMAEEYEEVDNLLTVCSPEQESDANLIAELRNASPWLLEAAACFQPGDADLLRWMRTAEGDAGDGSLEEVHDAIESLLIRMEKAAEIMEGQE